MTTERYLIRAAEIASMEGLHKAHFLNENAVCVAKSLGDLTGLTGVGINVMEVPVGRDSTEPHFHYREDEAVYILSGHGVAIVGDDSFEVSAGDFLGYRKGGLPHGLRNSGEEVLRCLVIGERGDTDILDYPNQQKRMFRTKDLAWNVVDMADIQPRAPRKV